MGSCRPRGVNRTGEPPLAYEEVKRRVFAALDRAGKRKNPDNQDDMSQWAELTSKAQIGGVIWPNNDMHAQGLAGAASRMIKRMELDGLVHWTYNSRTQTWTLRRGGKH